jgi:anaphase-promoting complex subunit 2
LLLLEISRHIQLISIQEDNLSGLHLHKNIFAFVKNQILPWLNFVFQPLPGTDEKAMLEQMVQKINFHVYHYYSQLRINNIFDIIVDYPESECAIEDLKQCLAHTNQHEQLLVSLSNELHKRLLKAGTTTHLILDIYIKTVRSLKLLDPSGILLEVVTPTVRDYLTRRKDFLKCLVLKLIDESPQGLFEELASSATRVYVEECDAIHESDDVEWNPKPRYSIPNEKNTRNSSNMDLISNLVNLTTGKEVLVNQYIEIIHDRLLTVKEYDCDKEFQQVEFLKMKFGEQHLHKCEVMLKDIADSKRVNEYLTKTLVEKKHNVSFLCEVIIISGLFWPTTLSKDQYKFSSQISNYFEEYSKQYEAWKSRSLHWFSDLGVVELQLELDGKVQDLSVTPFQANIILLFSEKSEWTIEEIAVQLGVPEDLATDAISPRLSFWVNKGFIKKIEGKGAYSLVDSSSSIKEDEFDEDNHANEAAEEDHLVKLHTITKQFIVGMCKNQGSASRPVAVMRIHMMLPMVLPKELQYSVYFKDLESLVTFMDKLVKEGVLDSSKAGYWCV